MVELHIFQIDFLNNGEEYFQWYFEATYEEIDEIVKMLQSRGEVVNAKKLNDVDKYIMTHRLDDKGQIWCKTGFPRIKVSQ